MQSAYSVVIFLLLFVVASIMIVAGFIIGDAVIFIVGVGLMFVVSYIAQHY